LPSEGIPEFRISRLAAIGREDLAGRTGAVPRAWAFMHHTQSGACLTSSSKGGVNCSHKTRSSATVATSALRLALAEPGQRAEDSMIKGVRGKRVGLRDRHMPVAQDMMTIPEPPTPPLKPVPDPPAPPPVFARNYSH
jgi:hypothetical protein